MGRVSDIAKYVERVQETLDRTYDGKHTTQGDSTPVRDLLTDIVHYTRHHGIDLERVIARAREEADWEEKDEAEMLALTPDEEDDNQ